jgi:hypothetical protein
VGRRRTNPQRWRHINGRRATARWRDEPASPAQLRVLARIARETGRSFSKTITKGAASDVIRERFAHDPKARQAHRRAQRKRTEQPASTPHPHGWRFGREQTRQQERNEIEQAKAAGLTAEYERARAAARP